MFEKSLGDLVRGIRSHKGSESQYISQCMTEIKKELKQENLTAKANAVSKLTYLQMLGYDITWAAFNIIEVMSSTKFTFKRIGYLAAAQCFYEELDVVMLTTNMVRKDISSTNQYDASLALNGLACFMTPDLARDLANDVLALMSSSRPYLRRKAILVMYKVFLKFPDALRPAFSRLKDKLDDPDSGVQSAAVSVICELARRNPRNYLSLAPTFFKLMTSSTNNWMLIKIIKLFGALTPLEPRLGKKLVEPMTSLIHSTTAMSLLYECITTVISGIPNHTASVQLCVSKLRLFIEDADQNLKYLGLLAMSHILKAQPKAVQQLKDIIVECLDDRDDSIRLRALDLISGMVTKKNIAEIVKKLMLHMDQSESASYRDEVLSKIIRICCHNNYHYITNFEWYITVLVEMTRFEGTKQGRLIASQMLDVSIRVKDARPFSVKQMATILENTHLFTGSTSREGICEVLYAASWIVGEFSEHLSDPRATLDSLLNPKVTALPGHVQAVFVQNIVKLYASILVKAEAESTPEAVEDVGAMLVEKLPVFVQSGDLEVQERACCILQLMKYIVKLQGKGAAVGDELVALFAGDLNPVASKAQRKVPVPEGLDLDKWIYEPPDEDLEGTKDEDLDFFLGPSKGDTHRSLGQHGSKKRSKKEEEEDEHEMKRRREQRRLEQASNPHYLKVSPKMSPRKQEEGGVSGRLDIGSIPVNKLELGVALVLDEPKSSKKRKGKRGKKKRKGKKGEESEEDVPRPAVDVSMGEMPEGAMSTDEEVDTEVIHDDLQRALDQNLDVPLRDDEVLPVRRHREVMTSPREEEEPQPKKKEKDKGKKKKKAKKVKEHESEEVAEREEGEGEVEVEEEEQEKPRVDKKKKKRSKKGAREKKKAVAEPSLIDISGQASEDTKPSGEVSIGMETIVMETEEGKTAASGELDDLEFWLSKSDAPSKTKQPLAAAPEAAVAEQPTEEPAAEEGKTKKKKDKKAKKKRESKKHKHNKGVAVEEEGEGLVGEAPPTGAELLNLDLMDVNIQNAGQAQFNLLAEDENINMTYEVRANPLHSGQVTVAVVFSNKSTDQLVSIEFNVLDSLNAKLERPMGSSAQDSVKVPFQLPPGTTNECQFIFYVQSFQVPQKLRGTATYMIKSDEGTMSDKVDFTVLLPCSAFICPVPTSQQQFASLLSSGNLCNTQNIRAQFKNTADFDSALAAIAVTLHLVVVEKIDQSASLYGASIAHHHVCLLVKTVGEASVSINAKGSDSQLISNLLDEIKAIV